MRGFGENTAIGMNTIGKTRSPNFLNPLLGISEMIVPKSRYPPVPRPLERASSTLGKLGRPPVRARHRAPPIISLFFVCGGVELSILRSSDTWIPT